MADTDFPLEFPFSHIFSECMEGEGIANTPFVVAGMLTPGYAEKACKLTDSCRKFHLPHVLYEVPTVHHSISPKGCADLRFTKANFIHFVLEKFNKPVLYLDIDTYFAQYPEAIESIARAGCDFAIYNWLADQHTEAYKPLEVNIGTELSPIITRNRFYAFSHSVDHFSKEQLVCSGAVQLYGNALGAKNLLRIWHETVARFEKVSDDQCLDFAYNNYPPDVPKPMASWLDKSCARYAFWIYAEPVINHPDMPHIGEDFCSLEDPMGSKCWYPERMQLLNVEYIFPRNCVIDVERKQLCRVEAGRLVPFAKFDRKLWV